MREVVGEIQCYVATGDFLRSSHDHHRDHAGKEDGRAADQNTMMASEYSSLPPCRITSVISSLVRSRVVGYVIESSCSSGGGAAADDSMITLL